MNKKNRGSRNKNRKYLILMALLEVASIIMGIKLIQQDLHMGSFGGTSLAGIGLALVVTGCMVEILKAKG